MTVKKNQQKGNVHSEEEPLNDLRTVADVAEYLAVSPRTVHRWIKELGLPCYRVGGSLRFRHSEIKTWLSKFRQGQR
jgi:excisionase family DNA binding protein